MVADLVAGLRGKLQARKDLQRKAALLEDLEDLEELEELEELENLEDLKELGVHPSPRYLVRL